MVMPLVTLITLHQECSLHDSVCHDAMSAKGCKEVLLPSKLPKCAMTNLGDLIRLSGCCLLHCSLYSPSHAPCWTDPLSYFSVSEGDWRSGSKMSMVWLSAPVLRLTVTDELGLTADRLRLGLGLLPVVSAAPSCVIEILPERERLRPCLSLSEFLS